MNADKRLGGSGEVLRALCAQVFEDDGMPMRRDHGRSRTGEPTRKDLQLCKQALRALNGAMQLEAGDAVIRELTVIGVDPDPDVWNLRVRVEASPAGEAQGASAIMVALKRAKGFLRIAVAQELTRKRAPSLTFVLVPRQEDTQ